MIRVHVHERAVKPDRAFVERDQRADVKGVDLRNAERDRVALAFVERRARAAQKALQIIAARHARFDFEASAAARSLRTSMKVAKKFGTPSRNCCT